MYKLQNEHATNHTVWKQERLVVLLIEAGFNFPKHRVIFLKSNNEIHATVVGNALAMYHFSLNDGTLNQGGNLLASTKPSAVSFC